MPVSLSLELVCNTVRTIRFYRIFLKHMSYCTQLFFITDKITAFHILANKLPPSMAIMLPLWTFLQARVNSILTGQEEQFFLINASLFEC